MTETTTTGALYAALAAAQERCKPVGKDGKNEHHGYRYASAEAIYTEARHALEGTGLSLLPTSSRVEMREAVAGPGGKFSAPDHDPNARVPALWLVREFDLVHASGESRTLKIEWPIVLDRGRSLDKAVAGAETSSLAYLYRDLLSMPRVDARDDMNHDSRRDPDEIAAEAFEREQAAKPRQTARGRNSNAGTHPKPQRTEPQGGAGPSPPAGSVPPKSTTTVPPPPSSPAPDVSQPSPETVSSARRIGPAALEAIKGRPETVLSPDVAAALIAEVVARAKGGEQHPLVVSWRKKFKATLPSVAGARGLMGVIGLELEQAAREKLAADEARAKAEAPKDPVAAAFGLDREEETWEEGRE